MLDLLAYGWSLFRRRLGWFAAPVVLCSLGGVAAALLAPAVYVASAVLVVEAEKIPDELAASTVETRALEHLHIIEQRVLSREVLTDLAADLGLLRGQDVDAAIEGLRARIGFDVTGDARGAEATLLALSVEGPSPREAAALANELVTLVLAEDVAMRTSVARQTLDFFSEEVARLEQELSQGAEGLLAFREEHRDALPDSLPFRRTRHGLLVEQLEDLDARQDEVEALHRRQVRLHRAIHGVESTASDSARVAPEDPNPAHLSTERRRLRNLRAQRDALPEDDPARGGFDDRIASLERLLGADEAEARTSAYERRIDDYLDEIADLEDRRARAVAEIAELQRSIDATAGLSVQLETLERDQHNRRARYDEALQALAVAETGDAIESLSKGQRVAVIEQAVPPRRPDRPNRAKLAAGGVAGGVALGLALVAALVLLTSDLRRPADLTRGLGIEPFGTLPYIAVASERRRTRRRAAAGAAGAVALLLAAAGGVHLALVPLDLLASAVAREGVGAVPEMIGEAIRTRRG